MCHEASPGSSGSAESRKISKDPLAAGKGEAHAAKRRLGVTISCFQVVVII